MERSGLPSPHLVNGLRRLVSDLNSTLPLPGHGLSGIPCSTTELISFEEDSVQYCGEPVADLMSDRSFEEVVWLLLNQRHPNAEQLADMQAILVDAAVVDSSILEMVERIPLVLVRSICFLWRCPYFRSMIHHPTISVPKPHVRACGAVRAGSADHCRGAGAIVDRWLCRSESGAFVIVLGRSFAPLSAG